MLTRREMVKRGTGLLAVGTAVTLPDAVLSEPPIDRIHRCVGDLEAALKAHYDGEVLTGFSMARPEAYAGAGGGPYVMVQVIPQSRSLEGGFDAG